MPFRAPNIGELRQRIDLQEKSNAPASAGTLTDNYTTVASVWARVNPIFGGRILEGVQDIEKVTHNVCIRYRDDQAAWHFILFDGRRFKVRSVMNPDERKEWLEILAEEQRNA